MMYIILGLVLIAIGLFMVTKPESFYEITQSWKMMVILNPPGYLLSRQDLVESCLSWWV